MQELYNIVVWMFQNNLLEIVSKREKEIEKMVIRSFIGDLGIGSGPPSLLVVWCSVI